MRAVAGEFLTNLLFSIISLIGYTRTWRSARAHPISVLPRRVVDGEKDGTQTPASLWSFSSNTTRTFISRRLPPEQFLRFFFGVFFCRRILKLYGKPEFLQSVGETHLCAFTGQGGGDVELLEQLTRSGSRSPPAFI